jgi:hypothetical protein
MPFHCCLSCGPFPSCCKVPWFTRCAPIHCSLSVSLLFFWFVTQGFCVSHVKPSGSLRSLFCHGLVVPFWWASLCVCFSSSCMMLFSVFLTCDSVCLLVLRNICSSVPHFSVVSHELQLNSPLLFVVLFHFIFSLFLSPPFFPLDCFENEPPTSKLCLQVWAWGWEDCRR